MDNQTLVQEKSPKWREPISLKATDLKESILKTIDEIEAFANQNQLEFITHSGSKTPNLQSLKQFNSDLLSNLSKSSKKRIARKIFKLNQKKTLIRMNRFITSLSKLTGIEPIRVLPSNQEQNIMLLRDKFKKAKEEFLNSKTAFKTAKKEFKGKQYFA